MKDLQAKLQIASAFLRRFMTLIVIVIFAAMYGYLIVTSGRQASQQPAEAQVNEKFQGVSRPKIDEAVAERLKQLEDQNIETKAIFEEARNNPFSE